MKIPEELKQYLKYSENVTDYPPNAEKIINLMNKMNEFKLKADRALVKLSYESLASIILGEVDFSEYSKVVKEVEDDLYKYYKAAQNELPNEDGEYQDFYNAVEMALDYTCNSCELITDIIYKMDDIKELGGDELKKANEKTMINEFNRFTK